MVRPDQLTRMFDDVTEKGAVMTPDGMAFWQGTGPSGETCRTCISFEPDGYYSAHSAKRASTLKPGRCRKYKSLAQRQGAPIKASLLACKYWEVRSIPLPFKEKQPR